MTAAGDRSTVVSVHVTFTRTGERRYGVLATAPGQEQRQLNPAPGYDPDIPHDLVHYLVEAELKLTGGLFGRLAAGGGSLLPGVADPPDHRDRRRHERRRHRREDRLRRADHAGRRDMAASELLAGVCDVVWKVRHGRAREVPDWADVERMSLDDRARVGRVQVRLDRVAALWRGLPVGGSITFTWPDPEPASVRGR